MQTIRDLVCDLNAEKEARGTAFPVIEQPGTLSESGLLGIVCISHQDSQYLKIKTLGAEVKFIPNR